MEPGIYTDENDVEVEQVNDNENENVSNSNENANSINQQIRRVIQFGYKSYGVFATKHKATCKYCDEPFFDKLGTTSGFTRSVIVR